MSFPVTTSSSGNIAACQSDIIVDVTSYIIIAVYLGSCTETTANSAITSIV